MNIPIAILATGEIEIVHQVEPEPSGDMKKSGEAAVNGKDANDKEQSLQSLTIEIDPSFFNKEIVDSKTDNILSILTDGFRIAKDSIKKQRERLLYGNNFISNNEDAINREITRGSTYWFDQIEGGVTLESFKNGLVKAGVKKDNQKAQDFLMLFVLQGYGAILFSLGGAVRNFLNTLLNVDGIFSTEIERHQFKQKDAETNTPITEVTGNILINFNSFKNGTTINVGKLKIVAEVDNTTLDVKYNFIPLTFQGNDQFTLQLAKSLNDLGFKRLTKENNTDEIQLAGVNSSKLFDTDQNKQDKSLLIPDFRLFPYTLSELEALKKNQKHRAVRSDPQPIEYSGNNLDLTQTQNGQVGLPQTRLKRCATQLLSSKRVLQAIKQNMQLSLIDNQANNALLIAIDASIEIFENIDMNINICEEEDFNQKVVDFSRLLTRVIMNIRELVTTSNDGSIIKDKAEMVLHHLNIILVAFESSEIFIQRLHSSALDQFKIAKSHFDKEIEELTQNALQDKRKRKTNENLNHCNDTTAIDRLIKKVTNDLQTNFETSFVPYVSRNKDQSISHEFILLSMHIRCTIAYLNRKKLEYYKKMQQLKKKIVELKSVKLSSTTKANLQRQVEYYKKICNFYDNTIKILQGTLGEINCYFYTQDLDMKGLHPRNIYSDINNPDPRNASMDYMSFLTFQATKVFDGEKQQFSFFDYVLPWRWGNFRIKLEEDTKYYLNQYFGDNSKTPLQKFAKMKKKISQTQHSLFNIFRSTERKKYDELVEQAYQLCLLDAFGRGYKTPLELSQELHQYITEKMPPNYSQIKAFAEGLQAQFTEFERGANGQELQDLKNKLVQYELSSTAKACSRLSRNGKDLPRSVVKVVQANESMPAHDTNSSLPLASEELTRKRAQSGPKQDVADSCVGSWKLLNS